MTIPFDFAYYRPDTVSEAVDLYHQLASEGKKPMYYGGGTEIISMARVNNLFTDAVIDLKGIPECRELTIRNNQLVLGAGVTLTQLTETDIFPLLSKAGARVADHTIQGKITLGGNLCGTIIYREAVLPFLLTDSEVVMAGQDGIKSSPINQVFDGRLQLKPGELLLQVITDASWLKLPYVHVKKTRQDKVDYPLLTLCALRVNDEIRTAFSGLCTVPFRSVKMEKVLNDQSLSLTDRLDKAVSQLPYPILEDIQGTAGYRQFVLKHTLAATLQQLEGKH